MTIQTTLKVGDIVTIGKSKIPQVIVRSEHRSEQDGWWVDEIDTIPMTIKQFDIANAPGVAGSRYNMTFNDSKVKSFYFLGSMHGKGTQIKDADVKVIGTSALKKQVTVTYSIAKIKSYR
jgi:hypothetical protein